VSGLVLPDSYRRRERMPSGEPVRLATGQLLKVQKQLDQPYSKGLHYLGQGHLSVIVTVDDTEKWGPLLHVSAALPDRLPSWPLMRAIRDAFYGDDIDVMMVLPRAKDYVNEHEFCLQYWETPEAWGVR
jgi:hypothetical protein